MAKKKTPVSFDGWLGKVIDDETGPLGGRAAVAQWIGVSEQSVNRRSRGEVPYLAREVEMIARQINVPTRELVEKKTPAGNTPPDQLGCHKPKENQCEARAKVRCSASRRTGPSH